MNKDLHVNVNLEENRKALELRTDHKYTRNEKNRHTSTIFGIQNHVGMDIFYNCTILKKWDFYNNCPISCTAIQRPGHPTDIC